MKVVSKVKDVNARSGWRICAKEVRIPLKQHAGKQKGGKTQEGGSKWLGRDGSRLKEMEADTENLTQMEQG
jgi:hypothetical protein